MGMYISTQTQPLQMMVIVFYQNVNIYGQTNFLGPVTGGSSYTGPTGVNGNTGPQGLNGIATNTGALEIQVQQDVDQLVIQNLQA